MNMSQCSNGHFYNPTQGGCPHCHGQVNQQGKTVGMTPIQPSALSDNVNKTVGQPFPLPNQYGVVNSGDQVGNPRPTPPKDEGKTVGLYMKKEGIDPVVGWLVCIEGNERGKDYRIHPEKNSIGRSEANDIYIAGDKTISRENHATIIYDPKKKSFRLIAGNGRGIVYVNDEAIDFSCPLKSHDTIEIGETKLLFVPFCGEKFNW
jgi:hypothetical protein